MCVYVCVCVCVCVREDNGAGNGDANKYNHDEQDISGINAKWTYKHIYRITLL